MASEFVISDYSGKASLALIDSWETDNVSVKEDALAHSRG